MVAHDSRNPPPYLSTTHAFSAVPPPSTTTPRPAYHPLLHPRSNRLSNNYRKYTVEQLTRLCCLCFTLSLRLHFSFSSPLSFSLFFYTISRVPARIKTSIRPRIRGGTNDESGVHGNKVCNSTECCDNYFLAGFGRFNVCILFGE